MFRLILDTEGTPLDLTAYIYQKIDLEETPVYVDGQNTGTSKAGTPIWDRLHTRYTASFPLIPIPDTVLTEIMQKCELSKQRVNYTGVRGLVGCYAQVSLSGWRYATEIDGVRIFAGAVITIEGA